MQPLKRLESFSGPEGPVVLCIMDGVGIGKGDAGDMVAKATKPNLDWLKENSLFATLKAHGRAVGMPDDGDMGNSEVGHNAIGSGRVFDQGALLVKNAVESGDVFDGDVWKDLTGSLSADNSLHFIGLLSDGNVHSHINILFALIRQAQKQGIKKVRVHTLLDGRDVPPTSALEYISSLEAVLTEINDLGEFDYCIASGGGRLYITMDRYDADWPMIERGWQTHVRGEGRKFATAKEAVETLRAETPGVIDQDLKEFVIERDGTPVGPIVDGDSVILFNFRGDRAIEISKAFDDPNLDRFDRGPIPAIKFAGIMQYEAEQQIPKSYLVSPPAIDDVMGEYLAVSGVRQLAVSETQKYGHVTYFFNGNRSGKFAENLEDYVEITSDLVPYEQRPWMKGAEITEVILDSIEKDKHDFIRVNYPNGDMVGHTGDLLAVEISVETVDLCLGRLIEAIKAKNGIMIVTADHGNADEMYEVDKEGNLKLDSDGNPKSKTSHTLNPVPCYIYDASGKAGFKLAELSDAGISSLAATSIMCLGFEPPADYDPSLVELK
ncbi:2,3-bisphosphoglycerate-independent phosphoglycerate mutase [Mariniblastus fucicola]|uniref:2,3-bisphosphoglycerate-independent phosphoglycerate mutase n=1 Tax=Mariniblastus fucicola TaxID=980251 RepID=A0A5B9PFL9_9BACT|nr:2,3-bisphosphoglycerate-independent phosphoglycerate mutase [Mariniblastus fucicola]QEG25084.1 2,3-bisphosphoglycerate-independent phosphoglycerate mutase [Mariniblastus fucicola]